MFTSPRTVRPAASQLRMHCSIKVVLIAFVLLLALSACGDPIIIPLTDTTPPSLGATLTFNNRTLDISPFGRPITIELDRGSDLSVLAGSEDIDGGVQDIIITIGLSRFCSNADNPNVVFNQQLSMTSDNTQNLRPGQEGRTAMISSYSLKAEDMRCGGRNYTTGINGTISVTGRNYHGGTSTTIPVRFVYRGDAPQVITVGTYNIWHGFVFQTDRIALDVNAAFINDSGADIVFLQEVDRGVDRSGDIDEVTYLMEATDLKQPPAWGKTEDLQGGEYGDAIISRFPLSRIISHDVPNTDKIGMLEATADIYGMPVRLFNLHLSSDPPGPFEDNPENIRAINYLVQQINRTSGPVIVGGDLNQVEDTAPVQELLRNTSLLDTFSVAEPKAHCSDKRIDFIFYSIGGYRVTKYTYDLATPGECNVRSQSSDHGYVAVELLRSPISPEPDGLNQYHRGCANVGLSQQADCMAAVHRWCLGNQKGKIGLAQEVGSDMFVVACFEHRWQGAVAINELTKKHPHCTNASQSQSSACVAAISRWCNDTPRGENSVMGRGGIAQEVGSNFFVIACFNPSWRGDVPLADLTAKHIHCNNINLSRHSACVAAMHRWCADNRRGGAGFAQEVGPDFFVVACLEPTWYGEVPVVPRS